MKKRILLINIFGIFIGILAWLVFASLQKLQQKEARAERVISIPEFVFYNLDSTATTVNQSFTQLPIIIIYFHSRCEHCVEEGKALAESSSELDGVQLLLISSERLNNIEVYKNECGLDVIPHLAIGKVSPETSFKILEISATPHIFIYNKEGSLVKEYKGITKTETLIKYAKQQ